MDRKYLPILVGFFVSLGIFLTLITLGLLQKGGPPLIPYEYVEEFIVIIPGSMYTDIIILYLLPIIFFGIFYLIAPYIVILYLKVH
ncbi:MAG TPA: hypothetical protein VMV49_14235 [Candidatus Deferrimicrobium sp.]|nr:hypothetical protein [Candidatus Deferrimicrobium sp.]